MKNKITTKTLPEKSLQSIKTIKFKRDILTSKINGDLLKRTLKEIGIEKIWQDYPIVALAMSNLRFSDDSVHYLSAADLESVEKKYNVSFTY